MSTDTEKLIDDLTDEELAILSREIRCKRDLVTGDIKCSIPEDYSRALAKAKNQPKRIIFEVTTEPAAELAPEPTAESAAPVTEANDRLER